MDKLISLEEAIASVRDNDMVALGGNALHRAPMSACREIARQKKRGLRLVKTAGAMDVDLLCLAGCVQSVDAGFISYETEYSLAAHYRKAVQEGRVVAHEHACYTVISALRAASAGIPFMPVKGLMISDLIEANDYFDSVRDPFSGEEIHVVKALQPDVCILHVQEAEKNGNAAIGGPQYEDVLMSRASKRVIITAEKIVPEKHFSYAKRKADIPHFLVDAVVHVPRGASPCSCSGLYDINRHQLEQFKKLTSDGELQGYLEETKRADRGQ